MSLNKNPEFFQLALSLTHKITGLKSYELQDELITTLVKSYVDTGCCDGEIFDDIEYKVKLELLKYNKELL